MCYGYSDLGLEQEARRLRQEQQRHSRAQEEQAPDRKRSADDKEERPLKEKVKEAVGAG